MLKQFITVILLVLLIAIFVSLWLFPSATPALGIAFLLFSVAIAASSIFEKHKTVYLKGETTQELMHRKIAKDVSLLVITILLVIFLGGIAGLFASQYASAYVESHWQGVGMIAGFMSAILVSFVVGYWVRRGVGKLGKQL